jgi:hypothetical protein
MKNEIIHIIINDNYDLVSNISASYFHENLFQGKISFFPGKKN